MDREARLAVLENVGLVFPVDSWIIRIAHRLKLGEFLVSDKYTPETRERSDPEEFSRSDAVTFDSHGNLAPVLMKPLHTPGDQIQSELHSGWLSSRPFSNNPWRFRRREGRWSNSFRAFSCSLVNLYVTLGRSGAMADGFPGRPFPEEAGGSFSRMFGDGLLNL